MENNGLFIDTSGFYALLDRSDKNHKRVVALLQKYNNLFTSNYIIDELITLLRVRKVNPDIFFDFITSLINGDICAILRVTHDIELGAWDLLKKFREHDFSFTDCTSFILMKKRNLVHACSLDKHFLIAGFNLAG